METVRLRLVFDQVLSKSQKNESLKRSWILLKPQHQTISDLSSYLLNAFDLQNDCPCGLLLSMEGFALPAFESTSILKDKDIIRVEKNEGGSSELVLICDETNSLDVVEIVDTQPVVAGMKLLANEEFEKESGGYQSEEEEKDAPKKMEDEVHVENTPEVKTVSKKRKPSKELRSCSKKKKKESTSAEKGVAKEAGGHDVSGEQNGTLSTASVDERNKSCKNLSSLKRLSQHKENGNGSVDATSSPNGTNKFPSRSARRKQAKRRWMREKLKAERKELHRRQLQAKSDEQSSEEDSQGVSQESTEKGNQVSEKVPERDSGKPVEGYQRPDQDTDVEDDVVPVVVRPGHIRFEPFGKVGANWTLQQNQVPSNTFHWNGITSKKRGQKWGKDKVKSYKGNDYRNGNQEHLKSLNIEARPRPAYNCIDFEKLEFYTSLPKEGDVIAYRLLELSSSLTPELSSYRVGKISRYDIENNNIQIVPVPGYPGTPAKQMDYNAFGGLSEACARDGSTWKEFSSLCEVRLVTRGNLNSVNSVASGVDNRDEDNGTSSRHKSTNEANTSAQENGVDPWEQINQALEAKKAQLSQEDNWNKTQSSDRRPWSYKALRSSALGPTMALLRSQNEL